MRRRGVTNRRCVFMAAGTVDLIQPLHALVEQTAAADIDTHARQRRCCCCTRRERRLENLHGERSMSVTRQRRQLVGELQMARDRVQAEFAYSSDAENV